MHVKGIATVADLFRTFLSLFYGTEIDRVTALYNNNAEIIRWMQKNNHLAYNIIIAQSIGAVLKSKLCIESVIECERELWARCRQYNMVILIVNLGAPQVSDVLDNYGYNSSVWKDLRLDYDRNVLSMADMDDAGKVMQFMANLRRCQLVLAPIRST